MAKTPTLAQLRRQEKGAPRIRKVHNPSLPDPERVADAIQTLTDRVAKAAAREKQARYEYEQSKHAERDAAFAARRNAKQETLQQAAQEASHAEAMLNALQQISGLLTEHEEVRQRLPEAPATDLATLFVAAKVAEDIAGLVKAEAAQLAADPGERPRRRRLEASANAGTEGAVSAQAAYRSALRAEVLRREMDAIRQQIEGLVRKAISLDPRLEKGLRK